MPQSLRQTIKGILVAITVLLILRIIAWEYTHKRKPKATKHLPAKNTQRIVDANFTTPSFKNKTRITIHTPQNNIPNTPPTVWKRSTGINSEFFNTLWVTIITPQSLHVQNDVHRERHVRALLQKYPFIQRFATSDGIDTSCQNILRLQKITIGSAYYSDEIGHGWVHPGKIGNWCSFLRFLRACGEQRGFKTCVWVENDVNVTDSMLHTILNISNDMMRGVEPFPVVHPGGTWEVVLVQQRRARDILARFYQFEIIRPVDREFWGMRDAKKLISNNKVWQKMSVSISTHKEHSTIICSNCSFVTTDSINRLVYGFDPYLVHNKSTNPCLDNIANFSHACSSTYRKPGPDHLCHTPGGPNAPPSPWLQRLPHTIHLPSRNSTCHPALHFPAHPQRFSSVEFQCYSQNTEDGILLALLLALGTASPTGRGRGIEIAGGLGWENNLINLAVNFDFDVLFFDGDPGNSRCARNFLQAHPATAPRYEQGVWWSSDFVTRDNFNAIIANITQWSGEIDVLSIDIDGMDFWLWDALHVVRPRIVVVEIQELWGPTLRRTRPYNPAHVARGPDAIAQMGASLGAFTELARRRGYRLAGCIRRGFNAFFVHEDAGDLDAVLGLGKYDPAGCFAHVDAAWQRVLDQRRAQAQKYAWVDPFAETSIPNHDAPTSPIQQPQTNPRALLALDDAAFAHLPASQMTTLYHPPAHGQAARTHTCDEDFGHGLVQRWRATRRDWCVPSEKTQRSRITCYFLHQTDHGGNGDNLCTLHIISADMGVFADTRATHPVMQRYHDSKHHDDAYIHYDKGFVQADCTLDHAHYATDKFPGWNADWLVSGLATTPLELCHTTEHLPTLIVQRDGFANLYHSSEDFINAYLALAILELSVADVQVVLTDLYPWGPFAAIWQEAFGFVHPALTAWDLRAKYGTGRVCFDNLIVGIYGPASPFCIMKTDTHCERSPLLRSYADFIIRGTRLHHHAVAADANRSHTLRVTWMARRSPVPWPERVFCDDRYFSCTMFAYSDRHLGRVVKNNEAVVDGLRATARDTVLPGRALVFTETDYNALPFREQLAHTLETDILVGPHGAGLTHQMFLGDDARVIELFIDGSSPNRHFHNMARWRGRTGGMYQGVVMPNPVPVQRVQDLVVDAARQFRVVAVVETGVKTRGVHAQTTRHALAAVVMLRIFDGDKMRHTFREVREWMAWMRHAGVEHVYVYDNWLHPDESLAPCFATYIAQNLVTYIAFPGLPYAQKQRDAYAHWLRTYQTHAEWVFVGDFDEYPHMYADAAPGFLRRLTAQHQCAVYFQNQFWVDVEQNKSAGEWLAERYVRRDRNHERFPHRSKVMVATTHVTEIQVHGAKMRPPCHDTFFVVPIEQGALEHYWGTRMVARGDDPGIEKFYANTIKPDLRMARAVRAVKALDAPLDVPLWCLAKTPHAAAALGTTTVTPTNTAHSNAFLAHQASVLAHVQTRHAWETQATHGESCTPWLDRPAPQHDTAYAEALAQTPADDGWCSTPCPRDLAKLRALCTPITFSASMENDGTCVAGSARHICMSVDSRADVHMQYFGHADLGDVSSAPPAAPTHKGFLASFVSNCVAWRTAILQKISDALQARSLTTHHYGHCLHNAADHALVSHDSHNKYGDKNALAMQHRYTFAFENSETPGYVTEKLFYTLSVPTTVAVYRGAADVRKFLPAQDAAWVFSATDSAEDIARALAAESDADYALRHRWRNASWEPKWLANVDYSVWHSTCRACVRARSLAQPASPATGLFVREMGFVAFQKVPTECVHGTDYAEFLLCIATMLEKKLSAHERSTRPYGVGAVVLLYRAWDREKCPLLSRDAVEALPAGTELEAVLENPCWTRRGEGFCARVA